MDTIRCALDEHHLDAPLLELELTENGAMQLDAPAADSLRALRHQGVTLAIDSFGAGYSSLSLLKQIPIDLLKIDRGFVEDGPHNPRDASIVRGVVTMAHGLKLKVLGEGVESEAQLAFLRDSGCDYAQGFHLGHPLPAAELTALLRRRADRISAGAPRSEVPPPADP